MLDMSHHTSAKTLVSFVIPVHNEDSNLIWHHQLIRNYLEERSIKAEFVYVDDGSTDNSLNIIKQLHDTDSSTRYVSFSKNFGKEAATSAGIQHARGDAVIIIDADGQHPITLLDDFIREWRNGFKVVVGVRKSNQNEGVIKAYGSKLFYLMLRILGSDASSQSGLTDFRLIDRVVIDEFNKLTEHNRMTRNLIDWLGFKRKLIPFHANARHAGSASYSLRKLLKLAVDGIVKHSTRPLKLIGLLGAAISFVSGLVAAFLVVEQYILNDPMGLGVTGTAIVAIFLSFMIGIVLFCQGLLALYLENVYYETQNRPLFVIEEEA